jgi:SHS2 domain-containing protein
MPVESLEHTSDLRLRAWGHSFQGTLLEISNYMLKLVYGSAISPDSPLNSKFEYDSDEKCVTRLLNDLLYLSESSGLAIRVRKITVCKNMVEWEGEGERFNKEKHGGSVLVKAATYDRLKVSRNPPLIEITLDI